jgi:hypothetical protein
MPSSALFTVDPLPLGLNEADTHRSRAIMIYCPSEHSLYTQSDLNDVVLIKSY